MEEHLSEEQWSAAALGAADDEIRAHINNCPACRVESERFEGAFAALRESLAGASEQPESFWHEQRATISARVSRQRHAERRLVWATALAALALVATMLVRQSSSTQVAAPDPDQALLMDVERSVERGVPEALAPAALLTQEVRPTTETKSGSKNSDSREGEHLP